MTQPDQERLLNEILPNVASQLRMPLGSMYVAMKRVAPAEPTDEKTAQMLAIMNQNYYRAVRLMNNLSSAPMLLETDPFLTANTDAVDWLESLVRQAQPLAEEAGLKLTFTSPLQMHNVALHKEHMTRLVWNLLSNAMKFTPRGGEITVSLRVSGGQVLLSVADNGCGISKELQETVFDRYLHAERADPLPHGLGLGLPLCRRIAEGHGGRIMLQSREGKGTTVTVSLPDKKYLTGVLRDPGFDYVGGFQPVLMELSDALPYAAFDFRHRND